eukprot:CAMPEP_0194349282 /NCGR_PEP_ID=MMETSP0171-20130528/107002_1 /TAXON_ID=218684 /ORGANISM="Corethron pennatum, Strain L29A3" /LENGTH=264 /DNA_ID=CAMNT_0039116713 /DNA_START=81 /DNA_END=872 /DNA_ORIENTATION=+
MDVSKKFSFVHISKCAGAAFVKELGQLVERRYPTAPTGAEYSVRWQKANYHSDYNLISLRSPRHHVWSLFTQCKYGSNGGKKLRGTSFPNTGSKPVHDLQDFGNWLEHFTKGGEYKHTRDDYGCYHPTNIQSRWFVSEETHPQHIKKTNGREYVSFEPDLDAVTDAYWKEDYVALADFYHESKCLLLTRLRPPGGPGWKYLRNECRCPPSSPSRKKKVQHHEKGHRSVLRDLPSDVLSKIGALTAVDAGLYRMALRQFLTEVAW